jgi:hypothetical protein
MRERLAAYERITVQDVNAVLARNPFSNNMTMFVGPRD